MNNFKKVETVKRMILDANREILAEDPTTDFDYVVLTASDYGIEDAEEIAKMLSIYPFVGGAYAYIVADTEVIELSLWTNKSEVVTLPW